MPAPRTAPLRFYERNITHNPRNWMGIWTPHGWRVHRKRFGTAQRLTVRLSGDGRTTFFPDILRDPLSGCVQWADDLHLNDDPFTDGGIYPCDPRVEHVRQRWAVSHTLLCYPVADHGLYTHEYTWDLTHGDLQTHFRRHVLLEEAVTDSVNGMTVAVRNTPISRTIEGNVQYALNNSAVRGVWNSPDRGGENYYLQREVRLLRMLNGVYAPTDRRPIVQCFGLWATLPGDPLADAFDLDSGHLRDRDAVTGRMKIALDQPKIGMFLPPAAPVNSTVYEGPVYCPTEHLLPVPAISMQELMRRAGARFEFGRVGYAAASRFDGGTQGFGAPGYVPALDLNGDGVIDSADAELLAPHIGSVTRVNLYHGAYFGGDWVSTGWCLEPNHRPGTMLVADYTWGGGYDAQAGIVRLLRTPGPNHRVFVEYHHDVPAEPGHENIAVHIYREPLETQ